MKDYDRNKPNPMLSMALLGGFFGNARPKPTQVQSRPEDYRPLPKRPS